MKTVRAGLEQDKQHVNTDLEKLNMTRKHSSLEEVQKLWGENKVGVLKEPESKGLTVWEC